MIQLLDAIHFIEVGSEMVVVEKGEIYDSHKSVQIEKLSHRVSLHKNEFAKKKPANFIIMYVQLCFLF